MSMIVTGDKRRTKHRKTMSNFTEWLEEAMFNRGGIKYRQKNLTDDLRVQAATVSRWINEKETPDDVNIRSLARLFGVKPSFIYKKLGRESPKGIDDENAVTELIYSLQQKVSPRLLREWINLNHVL